MKNVACFIATESETYVERAWHESIVNSRHAHKLCKVKRTLNCGIIFIASRSRRSVAMALKQAIALDIYNTVTFTAA